MRGKLKVAILVKTPEGITPADAGKTAELTGCSFPARDHPPRMREKREYIVQKTRRYRITPADAGKTFFRGSTHLFCQDHPRGCGENFYPQQLMLATMGSPPRMRGKLHNVPLRIHKIGITPADAGKTTTKNP